MRKVWREKLLLSRMKSHSWNSAAKRHTGIMCRTRWWKTKTTHNRKKNLVERFQLPFSLILFFRLIENELARSLSRGSFLIGMKSLLTARKTARQYTVDHVRLHKKTRWAWLNDFCTLLLLLPLCCYPTSYSTSDCLPGQKHPSTLMSSWISQNKIIELNNTHFKLREREVGDICRKACSASFRECFNLFHINLNSLLRLDPAPRRVSFFERGRATIIAQLFFTLYFFSRWIELVECRRGEQPLSTTSCVVWVCKMARPRWML